ncbi:MAG: HlyD family efflux transporter periplasmic adaptor subunit [Candidatus Peribacteria bacterium]|nr:MAG: HlyD family efflux transporter periplasmic adaptor subunit [Candidatus Peribacteria bacterium]
MITESDKLLGITTTYSSLNDNFEKKLGAANTQTTRNAETQLRLALAQQSYIQSLPENLSQDQLVTHLQTITQQLGLLTQLLNDIDAMLNNTNPSEALSSTSIATYIATYAALQARVQAAESSYITLANTIQSFLSTYRQQQESLAKSIDIAIQQRDLLARNLQDAETAASIGVDSAQNAISSTQKNKTTTEAALRNAIQQAQISYSEAQNQLAKLTVASPIAGSIGEILVDVGQEVGPGTPLFTISSNGEPQIEISLGSDELQFVELGQKVHVVADDQELTGTISSISQTADNNFTYQAIITLDAGVRLLGTLAQVDIPVKGQYPLLPINEIEIVNKSTGVLRYYEDGEIKQKAVDLGDVRGNLVEIRSNHLAGIKIITTDIKNFDPNKYELTIK